MAKSTNGVSKSDVVRKYFAKHPTAGVNEVIDALKSQGIGVSPALVKKIKYTTPKKGRPRKGTSSKADAIRAAIKEIGGRFRPRDVVASLAKKGVTVSLAQVSTIAKSLGMRRRKTKNVSPNGHRDGSVSINDLISAKKLADQLGGIERAKVAIHALARLS